MKFSLRKIFVRLLIFIIFITCIWKLTGSIFVVLGSTLILFILSLIFASIHTYLKAKSFKLFMDKYGIVRNADEVFEDNEAKLHGLLFFEKKYFSGAVAILEEGIFISKTFITSSYLPWKNIYSFKLLPNKLHAELAITTDEGMNKIVIPYRNEWIEVFNKHGKCV